MIFYSKVLEMDFHIEVLHTKNITLKQLLLVDECRNALQIQDLNMAIHIQYKIKLVLLG